MCIESYNENMEKSLLNMKVKIKNNIKKICNWETIPSDDDLEKIFKDVEKYNSFKNKAKSGYIKTVEKIDDIKQGDTIILTGGEYNKTPLKAEIVKHSEVDGVEVIINKRKNYFFNLGMYLEGKSWVKEVLVLV